MARIIEMDRSIIPALDVPFERVGYIVERTAPVEKVGGYKIGCSFLAEGMRAVTDTIRETADKAGRKMPVKVIYDHQKAATDIHESTPQQFMDSMVRSGVDAVILLPQAGPVTQYEWTRAAQERDLAVIVGGEMTHPRSLEGDFSNSKAENYTQIFRDLGFDRDLTGYLRNTAPEDIYELAARMGVTNFVMPGNKPARIAVYKGLVESLGVAQPHIFSPGLIAQDGSVSEGGRAAGRCFHGIIGRAVCNAAEPGLVAYEQSKEL